MVRNTAVAICHNIFFSCIEFCGRVHDFGKKYEIFSFFSKNYVSLGVLWCLWDRGYNYVVKESFFFVLGKK